MSSCTADQALTCDPGLSVRYTEDQVAVYADRVGASGAPWIRPMVIVMLRVNRLIYWKQTPNGLVGDCGSLARSGGVNVTGVVGSSAITGLNIASQAGANIAVAGVKAIPIIGDVIGFATAIFGIFGAAHAQAVATEQATLCQVAIQYDNFADAIEQAIATGQMPLQDALAKLKSVTDSLANGLASIEKQYNAPYGYHKAVNALALFNAEVVYPSLAPGVASSAVKALESPSGLLLAGGGLLGAKLLGVL